MTISRRGFLTGIFVAGAAPAIVKASSLMKIVVPAKKIVLLDPLHFGNMVWRPELVRHLPTHSSSLEELRVQPQFIHVTSLPIAAKMGLLRA